MQYHVCRDFMGCVYLEDAFQSVLSIKSPWNCVLDVESHSDPSLGSLIIQTLENGLLTCRLNVERIQTSGSEYEGAFEFHDRKLTNTTQDVDQPSSGDARAGNIFWSKFGGRHMVGGGPVFF